MVLDPRKAAAPTAQTGLLAAALEEQQAVDTTPPGLIRQGEESLGARGTPALEARTPMNHLGVDSGRLRRHRESEAKVDEPQAVLIDFRLDAMLLEDPVVRLSERFLATIQPVAPPAASTRNATPVEATGCANKRAPCDTHARHRATHARPSPTPCSLLAEHCHATRAGLCMTQSTAPRPEQCREHRRLASSITHLTTRRCRRSRVQQHAHSTSTRVRLDARPHRDGPPRTSERAWARIPRVRPTRRPRTNATRAGLCLDTEHRAASRPMPRDGHARTRPEPASVWTQSTVLRHDRCHVTATHERDPSRPLYRTEHRAASRPMRAESDSPRQRARRRIDLSDPT